MVKCQMQEPFCCTKSPNFERKKIFIAVDGKLFVVQVCKLLNDGIGEGNNVHNPSVPNKEHRPLRRAATGYGTPNASAGVHTFS